MSLLEKIRQDLQALEAKGLRRRLRTTTTSCQPLVEVDGRSMLAFCSNDYLGLAAHPQLQEALTQGAAQYGAGSGASHLISGHSQAHALLEATLAQLMQPFFETPQALYFGSGYMANMAILSAIGGRDAELFSDALNHASLIDGARLSRAKVSVYPHADVETLEKMLAASSAQTKIVATDSVFSMDGDLIDLTALAQLCEQHDAWLVVDDAHGFGVLGAQGCGALEHFGLRSPNVIYMGTLGKAAGASGAFVAADAAVIEWLVQKGRTYIYTTASMPAVAHAVSASLQIISGAEGAERRLHLRQLIELLRERLQLRRWQLLPSATAIQPVIIGSNEEALQASAELYRQGLWVPAIRPPTVPVGTARLRITLSAAHTTEQVCTLADWLNRLESGRDNSAAKIA